MTGIECATPLEAEVREPAADRRAQAALQPPLPAPGEGHLAQGSPASRGRGCPWSSGCSTTTPTTSGRSPPGPARRASLEALHEVFPIRQCNDRFGRRPARSPCVLAEPAPLPGAVRRQRRRAVLRRRGAPACRTPCCAAPTTSSTWSRPG
ncbi:hypothetical protein [Nocardioides convexus]|uniref:hypothetical protein n=1 Tax=Nocardioides convexus TaxID=2712224 RepID=UPI00241823F5|nr:hypothetical protein [Nocardioides convexus]